MMQRFSYFRISSLLLASFLVSTHAFLDQIAARLPIGGTPSPPGTPWPLPQEWNQSATLTTLDPSNFRYELSTQDCDILLQAVERYNIEFLTSDPEAEPEPDLPLLSTVFINIPAASSVNLCDQFPKLDRNDSYESYNVEINQDGNSAFANITATTVWGALRGLETFSQLVWRDRNWTLPYYYVNHTSINDWPRYPHRGIMVDTARHYLSPDTILDIITTMSYNKLNVLHWHIVDDQSFAFVSTTYPELSDKGAFIPGHLIYDPPTVQNIIEQARLRGIRVILEFDTPGHTYVYRKSHPELLTPCYGDGVNPGTPNYPVHADYEILDPTKNFTYEFMRNLFTEIVNDVIKDDFIHLGMDEVYPACWNSSPAIADFMKQNNYTELFQVQQHYTVRHLDMVISLGTRPIIWQDPLDHNVTVDKSKVVVQVWKSDKPWQEYFQTLLDGGYSLLLSSCWYLNYIAYGETWKNYYECDPELSLPTPPTEEQRELILGGEAAIWAEYADATNVVQRFFPFVGAVAEKLWSRANASNVDDAKWRLDEHRCRMLGRGIAAQPIYIGYCSPNEKFGWKTTTPVNNLANMLSVKRMTILVLFLSSVLPRLRFV